MVVVEDLDAAAETGRGWPHDQYRIEFACCGLVHAAQHHGPRTSARFTSSRSYEVPKPMNGVDPDLIRFYDHIEAVDIPVFIGGSIAASVWGEPRATLDIDLVIAATGSDAERFSSAFSPERYYVPPPEVVRSTLTKASSGGFNVFDSQTTLKADCYVKGSDELNHYGFATAVDVELGDLGRTKVASATYVIAMKLRYFAMSQQDKHLRDIRGIIMGSRDAIDFAMVERSARVSDTLEFWQDSLRRSGEE